jgi:hypothetical protein
MSFQRHCWGYEKGCTDSSRWYLKPECNDEQGYQRFKRYEETWKIKDYSYLIYK